MKTLLPVLTLLIVPVGVTYAQDVSVKVPQVQVPPATDATASASDNEKELAQALSLVRTTNLWTKTFDWKETGVTTEDMVAHVRTMLGTEAPSIEVRGKDECRSTFVLQKATLGSVLCSLAELANRRVWVFPGRLVLASEEDLTAEERAAVKKEKAGTWWRNSKWNANDNLVQATMRVVEPDLKQRLAAKGQTTPLPPPAQPDKGKRFASYELPFGELSPLSQKAIKDLVNLTSRLPETPPISSNLVICLDERRESLKAWFLKEPGVERSPFNSFYWCVLKPLDTSSAQQTDALLGS